MSPVPPEPPRPVTAPGGVPYPPPHESRSGRDRLPCQLLAAKPLGVNFYYYTIIINIVIIFIYFFFNSPHSENGGLFLKTRDYLK